MSNRSFEFFLKFHEGIPRQGPGTPEATTEAFRRIEKLLPPAPAILDAGCGSGGQTMTLAGLTDGTILGVDFYPPFVEALRRQVAARGLESRVSAQVGDLNALELAPESFDLIWSEGVLGIVGLEKGLRTLRPLLRGPGLFVLSEAVLLHPLEEAPEEVRAFWSETHPAIAVVEETLERVRGAGYRVLDHFPLPEEGWAAYVDPLERRMNEVLAQHPGDPDAEEAARGERREFDMFRNHLQWFGYEFFLLQRA